MMWLLPWVKINFLYSMGYLFIIKIKFIIVFFCDDIFLKSTLTYFCYVHYYQWISGVNYTKKSFWVPEKLPWSNKTLGYKKTAQAKSSEPENPRGNYSFYAPSPVRLYLFLVANISFHVWSWIILVTSLTISLHPQSWEFFPQSG